MSGTVADEATIRWQASASPGGLIGILATVLSVLLAGGCVAVLAGKASLPLPDPVVWAATFLFLALAGGFGFLVYGYLSIRYELGEQSLVVCWANRRRVIPLDQVTFIGPAIDKLEERPGRWQPFWPGYYVGTVRHEQAGAVWVVATLPLRRQLLISTGAQTVAISPERPVLFVEEYGRLRRNRDSQRSGVFTTVEPGQGAQRLADAGWTMSFPVVGAPAAQPASTRGVRSAQTTPSTPRQAALEVGRAGNPALRPVLLNDATALALLAVAVVLNVLMVTVILVRYESIPPSIALHWNVNGMPDRIGSPREIWILPVITGLVTLANFGLAWSIVTFDRFAARFLLGAACLVQVVAWVALLTLIA